MKKTFIRNNLKNGDVVARNPPAPSTTVTTVHDLPPDILMNIFSWFSVKELCINIFPVCKIWHLFSRDHFLWKHLSFKGDSVNTKRLCLLLSHATQLHSLQLVDREDATAVLRQVALTNRNLRILKVKRCRGSPHENNINEKVLLRLIKNCCRLVEITVKRTQFYMELFMKIMCTILPDLRCINFNHNFDLDSRSLNTIVCKCTYLEKVCIVGIYDDEKNDEYGIYDNDVTELCTRMKNSLKTLKVTAADLTGSALQSIAQCTYLHTLSICDAECLLDEHILLLRTIHNLSSLEVSNAYDVSSHGLHELFVRSTWNSLRKLILNGCDGVNDNVLETIGETFPNLEKISLAFCNFFTKNGMSKLIKGCNQLIFLRIPLTEINVVQSFPLIPDYTPNLRCLVYDCINASLQKRILGNARRILYNLKNKLPDL